VSESNVKWSSRRSAAAPSSALEGLDTGVSGFSIMSTDPAYLLRLGLSRDDGRFDTLTLFSRRDARAYGMKISSHADPRILQDKGSPDAERLHQVAPGDTLSSLARQYGAGLAELRAWNQLRGDQIFAGDSLVVGKGVAAGLSGPIEGFEDLAVLEGGQAPGLGQRIELEREYSDIFLRGFKTGEGQQEAVIYGMSVERRKKNGILYHSLGVNGAQMKSFARSARFMAEARTLDPDLVIIALGTNESMADEAPLADIEESLLGLITGFTKDNPKYVAFLLLTPPDVLDWRGRLNSKAGQVAWRLRDFAQRHGLALWDWNGLMGGEGSVLSWRDARLVLSDGVHMSPAGYQMQSRLFYQALMEAYGRF
jgi:lysophospholipase L1-like esterase